MVFARNRIGRQPIETSGFEIKLAAPSEIRQTLRLTLATRNQSTSDLERQVTGFIRYAQELDLDLTRHWFCIAPGPRITACVCVESPGRTAMLLLPASSVTNSSEEGLARLVEHVIQAESRRDIRLLQSLIQPEDETTRRTLERSGFREVAILCYMEHDVPPDRKPISPVIPPGLKDAELEWITYSDTAHQAFADLIAKTYEDSLDCPGLTGHREIEDVIAGHKAAGRFDPRNWLIIKWDGHAAGCLLFSRNPTRSAIDLVYTGIHPHYRSKGLGGFMMQHVLSIAHRCGVNSLTLAVDQNNIPALAMYQRAGFEQTTSRRAMILPTDPRSDHS